MNQLPLWDVPRYLGLPPEKCAAPNFPAPPSPAKALASGPVAVTTPETRAWDIIREVEDTDPEWSMTRARAMGGLGSSPTLGDYPGWLEAEAARQQELAQLYPDEAPRYTHRHTLLRAIADRLRDLGFESEEV